MLEMEYQTKNHQKNDQTRYFRTIKTKVASFLLSIPDPAAHSVALEIVKVDGNEHWYGRLDMSLGVCIGMVSLAVLEEMI